MVVRFFCMPCRCKNFKRKLILYNRSAGGVLTTINDGLQAIVIENGAHHLGSIRHLLNQLNFLCFNCLDYRST
jgi:hypothetical protein